MVANRKDILWKSALEDFFIEFLQFLFKDASELFDFSHGVKFLDKELAEILPRQELEYPKRIDMLIELRNAQGEEVLVHVEVQGYREEEFTGRIFTYYYRLRDKYKRPITCIVIYLGKKNNVNAAFYESGYLGTKLRLDFNTYYVEEQDEGELLESKNPFAIIILTALLALKHKKDIPLLLFDAKISLVKRIITKEFEEDKIRRLLNFIKLYINFGEKELNAKFDEEIKLLTNQKPGTMGILEAARVILEQEIRDEIKQEAQTSIAKKMKQAGFSKSLIIKLTGLSLKQVKML